MLVFMDLYVFSTPAHAGHLEQHKYVLLPCNLSVSTQPHPHHVVLAENCLGEAGERNKADSHEGFRRQSDASGGRIYTYPST